jgi:hypothetical protein
MSDVVDLTLSDSDEDFPQVQQKPQAPAPSRKREAATAAAAPSSPPAAAAAAATAEEEQQARKRIMDFARGKAADFAKARAAAAAGLNRTAEDAADATAEGGDAKRVKLTPPAADAPPAAAAAADGSADAGAAAAAASPGGFGNADLRALHEARMRRQQQQQQQQQDGSQKHEDGAEGERSCYLDLCVVLQETSHQQCRGTCVALAALRTACAAPASSLPSSLSTVWHIAELPYILQQLAHDVLHTLSRKTTQHNVDLPAILCLCCLIPARLQAASLHPHHQQPHQQQQQQQVARTAAGVPAAPLGGLLLPSQQQPAQQQQQQLAVAVPAASACSPTMYGAYCTAGLFKCAAASVCPYIKDLQMGTKSCMCWSKPKLSCMSASTLLKPLLNPAFCLLFRFKEEVAVLERMIGLGDIVRRAGLPTFICLQVGRQCVVLSCCILS